MRVHPHTSKIFGRAVAVVAATAVALAMLGGNALAARPEVRDHSSSDSAGATNVVCDGSECTATTVWAYINRPDGPSETCLDITRYATTGPFGYVLRGYERGCAPISDSGLSIDTKGLSGAAIAEIGLTLQEYICDAAGCAPTGTPRTASVSATYAGVGDINTFKSNGKSTFGGCTMSSAGKGQMREATATLTIDGQSVDALGSLFTSSFRVKVICH